MKRVTGIENHIIRIEQLAGDWLLNQGVAEEYIVYGRMLLLAVGVIIIAYIAWFVARTISLNIFSRLSKKTATKFDDFLVEHHAITDIAKLVPYIIVYNALDRVFIDFPGWLALTKMLVDVYLVLLLISIARSFLRAGRDYLKTTDAFKDKPINSFMQLVMIFLYIAGGLVIFSILTNKSIWAFLTAMGAASAILLLVFKDTILGFVASIQVSINDMVRIGDWISMDKYGADGDVVEINLATVKVQNWDKSITTIPTYFLIADSFKNWRGMQESGGRRIKRALFIKISSIRHLSAEDIEELKSIQLITSYLNQRQLEVSKYNKENNVDNSNLINGRRLTNIGVFRQYIEEYIQHHPNINQGMTLMIRQLDPTVTGMAIEVYAFSKQTEWKTYEGIMSDIFDHLMASVRTFHLETFEMPTTGDIRYLKNTADK